jgi:hypothetical protein
LGEKKAFARKKGYRHLEFLLHDRDPSVISNILLNPSLTEDHVVKISSSRAAAKEILEEIFRNDRWISRYRIKKALVFNRNTPLDISINLCSFLLKKDLKYLIRESKCDPNLLLKAKEVLAGKS